MTFRYPIGRVVPDYLRAAIGLALTAGPALTLDLPPLTLAVLVPLACLFVIYAGQAVRRQLTRLTLSEDGIRCTVPPAGLEWDRMTVMTLGYFSTRRDGRNGWMELKLEAGRARVRVDSRIDGFDRIVACAADVARRRGLALDVATASNLGALGIEAVGAHGELALR